MRLFTVLLIASAAQAQNTNLINLFATDPGGACPQRHFAVSQASGDAFYCNPLTNDWNLITGVGTVPTATTSTLGLVQPDGTTIDITAGVISVPTATSSLLGLVKPDGTIITDTAGAITVAKASSSLFGVAKVDNTTITASAGTISATGLSVGTPPTITGCGTISSQVGGALAGTFVTSATSCTPVLTILPTSTNGYFCMISDQSLGTGALIGSISSTTTTATFPTFTTVATNVLAFNCGFHY